MTFCRMPINKVKTNIVKEKVSKKGYIFSYNFPLKKNILHEVCRLLTKFTLTKYKYYFL